MNSSKKKQVFAAYQMVFSSLKMLLERRKRKQIRKKRRLRVLYLIMAHRLSTPNIRRQRRVYRYVSNQHMWEKDVPVWPDDRFQKKFRVSRNTFKMLVDSIGHLIEKQVTQFGTTINTEKRIAIALYFLKSGSYYDVVGEVFGVGAATVCNIVSDFCDAMIRVHLKEKIKFPQTENELQATADTFQENWQFPGCVGAIDGSHIPIKRPGNEGADYHNYKGWFSTVLLATVDANYKFTYVNVGYPGRVHDAGIFQTCGLKKRLEEGLLDSSQHLIGDGAFPLSSYMMKPFVGTNLPTDKELFNYRLSRARMTVENTFGRLKARWRILLKFSEMQFNKTIKVITTCCILHNLCEEENSPILPKLLKKVEEFNEMYPHPQPEDEPNFDSNEGEAKREEIMLWLNINNNISN